MLAVASIAFALLTQPVRAQTATPASNLVDQLVGPETHADIDIAALRQQAVDRIKSRVDATALERSPKAAITGAWNYRCVLRYKRLLARAAQ